MSTTVAAHHVVSVLLLHTVVPLNDSGESALGARLSVSEMIAGLIPSCDFGSAIGDTVPSSPLPIYPPLRLLINAPVEGDVRRP